MGALFKRYVLPPVVIVAMIALAILMVPLAIPAGIIFNLWGEIRDRRAAKRTPCPNCSRIVGLDSLRIGREELRLMRAKYDHANRVGWHPAICVSCGARLQRVGDGFVDEAEYMRGFRRKPSESSDAETHAVTRQ